MSDQPLLGEPVVLDDVGPPRRGRVLPSTGGVSLLALPALGLVGALLVWPVVRTFQLSLTDATGHVVWFRNFRFAFAEYGFWSVCWHTLLWALVMPVVVVGLGYLLAALSRRTRAGHAARLLLVAPVAVPLVATGVIFRIAGDPDPGRGLASALLAHLPGTWPSALGPTLVTVSLMLAFVWAWVGLPLVIFRAALDALPPGLADTVRAQGGTWRSVFWHAQVRPLSRIIAVVFAMVALGTARSFDLILIMAPGSVHDDAAVLAVWVWQTSLIGPTGPAAAVGVVWLVLVLAGMAAASFFVRQPWPPPRVRPAPGTVQRLWHRWRGRPRPVGARPVEPPPRPLPWWDPRRALPRLVTLLAVVVWLVPVVALVATSLHDQVVAATRAWWHLPLSLSSYTAALLHSGLGTAAGVTAGLATVATVLVLLLAVPAGYLLRPPDTRTARWLVVLLFAAMVVPIQVIAGPVTEMLGWVGVAGSVVGLALVHVTLGLPFAILVLRNAFADLPPGVLRTVRRHHRSQWRIMPALTRRIWPALAAVGVLEFVQVWNDLVIGLLFAGPQATPLGVVFYGQARQFVSNSGVLAASSVMVSVVPVALLVLARRQVVAGLISGGTR